MNSKIDSIFIKHSEARICQGDIFRDFKYSGLIAINKISIDEGEMLFPYLIVLTQDCDLELDHKNHVESKDNQDKYLISILVCPGYIAEYFREGNHLKEYHFKMEKINSERWRKIKNNQNPRYHFLKRKRRFQIPDLVIDFKHYYTIPRDVLYKNFRDHYIGSINELFREALSQRFAYYLSRIGLPLINKKIE